MKINLPFFKCAIYDDGAWVRFGFFGGFAIRDRTKSKLLFSQRKGNSLEIGKYTLHRLKAMTDPFKQVTDKLLSTFSESNLSAIALKVADKYNDNAVTDSLSIAPPVLKDINRVNLFDNSDKAFIDSLGDNGYSTIAEKIAFEVAEEFNR